MRRSEEDTQALAILNGLFGPHLNNLERSLNRATLRQSLLNQNLANVNTPHYKRRDVDFGVELARAERGRRFQLQTTEETPIRVDEGSMRRDGNSVVLEQEVVALAETEIRYRMLTEMTSRYFSGLRNVIREGR